MTTDLNYLIPLAVIGFIGLIVGLIVGFMASGLRGGSKTTQQKRNRDLIEVIRIWQDRSGAGLITPGEHPVIGPVHGSRDAQNHAVHLNTIA